MLNNASVCNSCWCTWTLENGVWIVKSSNCPAGCSCQQLGSTSLTPLQFQSFLQRRGVALPTGATSLNVSCEPPVAAGSI